MAGQIVTLSMPPYQTPIQGPNGLLHPVWAKWFQQMHLRIGGLQAASNPSAVARMSGVISQTSQNLFSQAVSIGSNFSNPSQPNYNPPLWVSPAGQSTIFDSFQATNTAAGAVTVSIYFVPTTYNPTSQPSSANIVVNALSVAGQVGNIPTVLPIPNLVGISIGPLTQVIAVASSLGAIKLSATGRVTS